MKLFDAHCHLQEPELTGDLAGAMARARDQGVAGMMCCGTREEDWERAIGVAAEYPGVMISLGLHPWYVSGRTEGWLARLESLVAAGGRAMGEIGLDHAMENAPKQDQADVFLSQLRLARRLRVPVSVHCRDAFGALLEILRAESGAPNGGVLHSYSGPTELVHELESMGFCLSFSGSITRSGNRRGQRNLAAVSAGRLLIETDCPAMLPEGAEGKVNEPANLRLVLAAVARLRGTTEETMAELTYGNALRLFGGRA